MQLQLFNTYATTLKNQLANCNNGLSDSFPIFVNILCTEARLAAANRAPSIKMTSQPPTHPLHFLKKYDEREIRFSDYFKQAFGKDLVVHRNAGSEVPLYVGERPKPKGGDDRVSQSHLTGLKKLDLLHMQGDGMRCFVGVLLNALEVKRRGTKYYVYHSTTYWDKTHIRQVQPPKLSIFSDNDSLQKRVDAITLFLARVIFPHNYSSIISKDVFACLDNVSFISINIYHLCVHN